MNEQDYNNSISLLNNGMTLQMGKYRIEKALASGGFGNTYEITNTTFDDRFALKEFFMKEIALRDYDGTTVSVPITENKNLFDVHKEKFKREAKFLRRLRNKHIVQVHDMFEENDTAYYVMDFIEGESLAAYLKRRQAPLFEYEVRDILNQILDALSEIHAQNIWHLDIKPGNIMRTADGNVVLIDFGASKQIDVNSAGTLSNTSFSFTQGYAPAEQVGQNKKLIGAWTDFYSLGATLYNLLTNEKPPTFMELSDNDTIQFNAPVSAQMQQLIRWMMSPAIRKRPQNVEEIRQFLRGNNVQNPAPMPVAPVSEQTVAAPPRNIQPQTNSYSEQTQIFAAPQEQPKEEPVYYDEEPESNNKFLIIGIAVAAAIALSLIVLFCTGDKESSPADDNSVTAVDSVATEGITSDESDTPAEKVEEPQKKDEPVEKTEKPDDKDRTALKTQEKTETPVTTTNKKEETPARQQEPVQSNTVYDAVEQMPAFPGNLNGFISSNLKYPAIAEENGVQGRVIVQFVVDRDGSISDIKVVRSVDASLDREAVRLVRSMPRWTPGKQNGKAVRVRYTLPINFRLQ